MSVEDFKGAYVLYARPLLFAADFLRVSGRAEPANPVTPIARQQYDLHTMLLIITGVIFALVFLVMFYAIVRHRKAAGHQAKHFHENTTVEIIWTVIPLLILIGMAWPATKVVLSQKSTRGEDMTIKVTGYQWKWRYDYLDDSFGFMSHLSTPREAIANAAAKPTNYLLEVDEPLVVPTGKKVRLLLTANDVIHSWWVPQLGVKQDAIPGFLRDSWFRIDKPGTYRGQCSELCGTPRLHAHRGGSQGARGLRQVAGSQEKQMAAAADDPNKVWTLADLKARGEKSMPRTASPATRPTARACPVPSLPWTAPR